MNQKSGGGQRQNAPRQMQRSQPAVNYERASADVLSGLEHYRPQLEPVLPGGMTWQRFHATIATLLHHNPSILKCTVPSIIRGCMKAAYDGLALDGREAALVPSNNKYGRPPNQVEKLEARYNPMVAGLRKQILQSGLVDTVEVILVYKGEPYRVIRGTSKRVEHEELIECRGPTKKIVAVYAVAEMKNGRQIVETMNAEEVEAIRAIAQTDNVWKTHTGEMYRKTCLRRIRKSLPGIGDVRDAEMILLFPEFSRQSSPVPAAGALPAPARPTRGDFQPSLEAPAQTIDEFNRFDARTGEIFDEVDQHQEQAGGGIAKTTGPEELSTAAAKKPAKKRIDDNQVDQTDTETSKPSPPADDAPKMPKTQDDWDLWADTMRTTIPEMKDPAALQSEFKRQGPVIEKAPERLRQAVNDAFTEQLAELASGPSDGAGSSQGSLDIPAGETQ